MKEGSEISHVTCCTIQMQIGSCNINCLNQFCKSCKFGGPENARRPYIYIYITLPETNSSHVKMDGWNAIVSFLGWPFFFRCYVSFRDCILTKILKRYYINLCYRRCKSKYQIRYSLDIRANVPILSKPEFCGIFGGNIHPGGVEVTMKFARISDLATETFKNCPPGDSKWPFHPLVGGHLTIEKGHLTIPKRSPAELPGLYIFKIAPKSWSIMCKLEHIDMSSCNISLFEDIPIMRNAPLDL